MGLDQELIIRKKNDKNFERVIEFSGNVALESFLESRGYIKENIKEILVKSSDIIDLYEYVCKISDMHERFGFNQELEEYIEKHIKPNEEYGRIDEVYIDRIFVIEMCLDVHMSGFLENPDDYEVSYWAWW